MKVETFWSHSFIPELVRPDGVVFDFGANYGGFSDRIAPYCGKVFAFEPDPSWGGSLDKPKNVTIIKKAVAAQRGSVRLFLNTDKCSSIHYADNHRTLAVNVEAIMLADAFDLHPEGMIDLVKMDIEGEEVPILAEAEPALLERVVQYTIEFHDFLEPGSLPAIRQVIAKLERLGFFAVRMSWYSYGDLLFLNTNVLKLSNGDRINLRYVHRYRAGLARIALRALAKTGYRSGT